MLELTNTALLILSITKNEMGPSEIMSDIKIMGSFQID